MGRRSIVQIAADPTTTDKILWQIWEERLSHTPNYRQDWRYDETRRLKEAADRALGNALMGNPSSPWQLLECLMKHEKYKYVFQEAFANNPSLPLFILENVELIKTSYISSAISKYGPLSLVGLVWNLYRYNLADKIYEFAVNNPHLKTSSFEDVVTFTKNTLNMVKEQQTAENFKWDYFAFGAITRMVFSNRSYLDHMLLREDTPEEKNLRYFLGQFTDFLLANLSSLDLLYRPLPVLAPRIEMLPDSELSTALPF